MCGIFGIIGERWTSAFDGALDSLIHRGPDARGAFHEQDVHLGHRRLAIIDLAGGQQPMISANGRYVITFNGEIYNFPQIAHDLAAHGVNLRTRSDTEVLLEAIALWGRDALARLDGIFAFVVWDRIERRLLAARDRFGIKPFFYATMGGFVFASTLEPFFHLPEFPRRICYPALREYLACQYIPAPLSILRDVQALPPASWLSFDPATHQLAVGRYWDIPRPASHATPLADLSERTDQALRESVRRQMVADVPLGAFLSGGIDSSLMVHYMAQAAPGAIRTFSVRFPAIKDYDESASAQAVAQQLGTEHHVLDAEELDAAHFAGAISHLDQPFADPAYLPTLALSELTRRHVTVAISGDGGDELFGGYARYLETEADFPDNIVKRLGHCAIEANILPPAGRLLRRTLAGREMLLWKRVLLGPWHTSRKSMARYLAPDAREQAAIPEVMGAWLEGCLRFTGTLDSESLMRGDLWTYLSDNCLAKVDRASMIHSLEVRVPMLGNPVADVVLAEPASVKLSQGLKTILKGLAQQRLPRQVWDRPKHGFGVPLKYFFLKPWRELGNDWVRRCSELAPFLDARAVQRQWLATLNGRAEVQLTYTLLALLGWLDTHRIDP